MNFFFSFLMLFQPLCLWSLLCFCLLLLLYCFALVCYFVRWGYCIVLMLLLPVVVILWCFYFVLLLCGVITSHCSCFVVVLQLRVGVVAPHWWYCFVMVLQIRIGAIIPCYYFALTLLLFPWFKWYPPLPCASGSLELIVPNF